MSTVKKKRKALRTVLVIIAAPIAAVLAAHAVGGAVNRRTPEGGINESLYVDINGAKQWINIYGRDKDNPVLLYLHGGPGSATSDIDYAFTRKWADVYTVVTWDQRNCGKSYDKSQNGTALTRDMFLADGKEMTEYLIERLGREKITVLGHSWGSFFGANLVLEYPELYECYIGTGQLVDVLVNETAFKENAAARAEGDPEAMALVEKLTPENTTMEHILTRNELMSKFGWDMMRDGSDYNLITTVLFNPNYSLADWVKYFQRDMDVYTDFFNSDEMKAFSLKGRTDYKVPYFNINGDTDYQTDFKLAEEYFNSINAPYKELFIMKDTTHGLLESKSEEFSKIVHQIADKRASGFAP